MMAILAAAVDRREHPAKALRLGGGAVAACCAPAAIMMGS